MSLPIVQVENLSKRYRLGVVGATTLREDFSRILGLLRTGAEGNTGEFWALRDLSFAIEPGEVVGVVGQNGAGKSTLLKILSRVTEPTAGRAILRGRVASLLEVGTGFHPDLTGRENVFLNGAILGMRQAEIAGRFDEIVAFSEVEKFIDTPVKHYSSGMRVRLAFAVAAHLTSEILILDEVLAVGDAAFQKKCIGKMNEVARGGRTVLFVTHNMAVISQLAGSCLWLEGGQRVKMGESAAVVSEYLKKITASAETAERIFPPDASKHAQVLRARVLNDANAVTPKFGCDEPVILELLFAVRKSTRGLYGYLQLEKSDGTSVLVSDSHDTPPNRFDLLDPGQYLVKLVIPPRTLGHGNYRVYVSFADTTWQNPKVEGPGYVCTFTLDDFRSRRGNARAGFLSTLLAWQVSEYPESKESG